SRSSCPASASLGTPRRERPQVAFHQVLVLRRHGLVAGGEPVAGHELLQLRYQPQVSGSDAPAEAVARRRDRAALEPGSKVLAGEAAEAGGFEPLDEVRALLPQPPPVGGVVSRTGPLLQLVSLALQLGDLLQPRRHRLPVGLIELLTECGEPVGQVLPLALIAAGPGLLEPGDRGRQVFLLENRARFPSRFGVALGP